MEIIGLILLLGITATVLYYLDLHETGWAHVRRFFNIPDKKSVVAEVKGRYTEVKQNRIKDRIEKQRQVVSRARDKRELAEKIIKQDREKRKQRIQQLVNSSPTKPPLPPKPIASSSGFSTNLYYNNIQPVTPLETSLKAALNAMLDGHTSQTPPKPEPIGTPVLKTLTLNTTKKFKSARDILGEIRARRNGTSSSGPR